MLKEAYYFCSALCHYVSNIKHNNIFSSDGMRFSCISTYLKKSLVLCHKARVAPHEGISLQHSHERLLVCETIRLDSFFFFFIFIMKVLRLHSKKCWVVSTQIWVKYGQTQMLG